MLARRMSTDRIPASRGIASLTDIPEGECRHGPPELTCAAVGVAGEREGPQGRGGGHAVRRWFVGYVTSVGSAILQEGVGVDTLLAAGWRGGLMTCLIHIANDRNSQLLRNEFAVIAK
jgi:hypothetical protein